MSNQSRVWRYPKRGKILWCFERCFANWYSRDRVRERKQESQQEAIDAGGAETRAKFLRKKNAKSRQDAVHEKEEIRSTMHTTANKFHKKTRKYFFFLGTW